jgi:hypothetical protein
MIPAPRMHSSPISPGAAGLPSSSNTAHSRNGAGTPQEPEPTISVASIGMYIADPTSVIPKASRSTRSKRSSMRAWMSRGTP